MSTIAFRLDDVEPVLQENVQTLDASGVPLWTASGTVRTAKGTKIPFTRQIAGANAADIRKAIKDYAKALDDAENVVAPKAPAAIRNILGQALDLKLDPVADWDAVP